MCFSRIVHELFHFLEEKSILCFQRQGRSRGRGWGLGDVNQQPSSEPSSRDGSRQSGWLVPSCKQVVCDYLTVRWVDSFLGTTAGREKGDAGFQERRETQSPWISGLPTCESSA